MNNDIKVIIKNSPFPDQLATDAEKQSKEYGLSVAKAVEGQWFNSNRNNSCRFYDQYKDFHTLRLYARGEQPVGKYKDEFAINGDLSHLNLDWSIVPIIPKFVDIVVNGINDRLYSIKAEAQDIMSAEKKNSFQENLEKQMVAKPILKNIKDKLGVNSFTMPEEEIPDTSEELSLYMQLKYKPGIEIAEETAISTLLELNEYKENVKPLFDYDVTTLGVGFIKHDFNTVDGVKVEYVDPASMVYSYTDKRDFSDCYYFGEVKQIHITELRKINPDITNEELKEIQNYGSQWYTQYPIARSFVDDTFSGEMVNVLFFNYKTDKRFVFKKKNLDNGGSRVIRRDESFVPNGEDDKFERVDIVKDVWYEGALVLGSNHLLKWNMLKNMVRPDSATHRVYPNYIGYAPRLYRGNIESLVKRMIPFADQIQLTHLKLQQVMARVVPDGIFIDADGLNEVDLGHGGAYNPEEALKLYFQTGSVVGRSYTAEGEFNNARVPIQPISTSSGGDKIAALVNSYNYYLNMIRDVTGLNEARDASTPNPDALVGVQKLAALNSNTATRHILESGLNVTKRLATCLSLRVNDILEYSNFAHEFAMQIGKYNLAILDDIKNLYLHSFGIFIQLDPDEEERQQLEANIQVALQRDQIDLEDAIDIRMIKNLKLANELLKVKRKRKAEAQSKAQQQQMEMQMQSNAQSQQAAAESKMQQIQAEAQAKIAIKNAETEGLIRQLQFEAELKSQLMDKEFNFNMQLKGIDAESLKTREKDKEKAKDDRVLKQATAQSKLIEQRQKGTAPVNFESSGNDVLGSGFDLEAFAPK